MLQNKKVEQPWSCVSLDHMYCSVLFICHENNFPITCLILYFLCNIDGCPNKGVYREKKRDREREKERERDGSCCPAVHLQPPVNHIGKRRHFSQPDVKARNHKLCIFFQENVDTHNYVTLFAKRAIMTFEILMNYDQNII